MSAAPFAVDVANDLVLLTVAGFTVELSIAQVEQLHTDLECAASVIVTARRERGR